ncbi:ORF6N domain-containing protein [Candidatus Dojkabacteria bacterium]|uniref:ORF6N domain-containing protein n=1 Tax=Candidatus Dojkabacteria bacterium TaxID=2099670 RepID=A0A955RK61_9BACT|nr:ORF6N domain-containing protein [Candidatus Dojkabacteria bacterium]
MKIQKQARQLIDNKIYTIRNQQVMLDSDLADLYGIETKVLNQAVSRNKERFPEDFMFRLTSNEFESSRSHFVTSTNRKGGRTYLPYAFTEQGVAMLSGVLKSKQAIAVNITIMRAFVAMKQLLLSEFEIKNRIDILQLQLEKLKNTTKDQDTKINFIIQAIEKMIEGEEENTKKIGFEIN